MTLKMEIQGSRLTFAPGYSPRVGRGINPAEQARHRASAIENQLEALQIMVARWALPWPMKYAFILAVTMPVLLFSYHYLVRPSWVGGLLNGRRYPRRWPGGAELRQCQLAWR